MKQKKRKLSTQKLQIREKKLLSTVGFIIQWMDFLKMKLKK